MNDLFGTAYYGIWVEGDDGEHGWLTISNITYWAPHFEIAKAQLKFLEINGQPTHNYTIRPFNPLDNLWTGI